MKKLLRTLAVSLAALSLAAVMGACTDGNKPNETPGTATDIITSEKPESGGEVNVGIAQDLDDSIDPHRMEAAGTREVLFNVFEGLIKPDINGNLIPATASSYAINEAGDVFTFTLREDVRFHNGDVVTVGDVVYSLTRCMGAEGGEPIITAFSEVKTVEATDDKTVVITLKEPNAEFLAYLTAAIIPEGYDEQGTKPIGTGPFKFVSRSVLENVVLEKFEDYWGTPAHLSRVVYKIVSNPETLVMSLNSGALDIVAHLTSDQVAGIAQDFNILEGTMNLVQALYLNNAVAPLDNINVRRALSHAVNREEIMLFLADGRGAPVGSSMYPAFSKYFMPELTDYYEYDTEKAKELLTEAGYPDGFDLEIAVPSIYTPHVITAEVLVEQLRAVGVRAEIRPVELGTWLTDVYMGRDFQATVIGFDAKTLTARAMLERWGSSAQDNMISFKNAEYDETLAAAMSAADEGERVRLYKRCQEILTEQAANVYIQDLCDLVAIRNTLAGYEFYPLYAMDMSKVYYTAS